MTKSSKSVGFATLLFVAFGLLSGCEGESGGEHGYRVHPHPHVPHTSAQPAGRSYAQKLEDQHIKDLDEIGRKLEKALDDDKKNLEMMEHMSDSSQ